MRIFKAFYVNGIMETDPDTGNLVELTVYKHENGGMFALDSSWILNEFDHDEDKCIVPNPFDLTGETFVELIETSERVDIYSRIIELDRKIREWDMLALDNEGNRHNLSTSERTDWLQEKNDLLNKNF